MTPGELAVGTHQVARVPRAEVERKLGWVATHVLRCLHRWRDRETGRTTATRRQVAQTPGMTSLTVRQVMRGLARLIEAGLVDGLHYPWVQMRSGHRVRLCSRRVYGAEVRSRRLGGGWELLCPEPVAAWLRAREQSSDHGGGSGRGGAPKGNRNWAETRAPRHVSAESAESIARYLTHSRRLADLRVAFGLDPSDPEDFDAPPETMDRADPPLVGDDGSRRYPPAVGDNGPDRPPTMDRIAFRSDLDQGWVSLPTGEKRPPSVGPSVFSPPAAGDAGTGPTRLPVPTPSLAALTSTSDAYGRRLGGGPPVPTSPPSVAPTPPPAGRADLSPPVVTPAAARASTSALGLRLGGGDLPAGEARASIGRRVPGMPRLPTFEAAVVPHPPLLSTDCTLDECVAVMLRTYAGAYRAVTGEVAWSVRSVQAAKTEYSKSTLRLLRDAARALRQAEIAPAAWVAWSFDFWCRTKAYTGHPPALGWTFSPGRITERQAWFTSSGAGQSGGAHVTGLRERDLARRWFALGLLVDRERAWEDASPVVARVFPEGFDEAVRAVEREVTEAKARLAQRVAGGEWVWPLGFRRAPSPDERPPAASRARRKKAQ